MNQQQVKKDDLREEPKKGDTIFTVLFLIMFVVLLIQYVIYEEDTYPGENINPVSRETIKILMWLCAMLAVVAHLTPKRGGDKKLEDEAKSELSIDKMNDNLK